MNTNEKTRDAGKMKRIVIGDIHGCHRELSVLCEELSAFCDLERDEIVFLGDYIDRGPDSKKVVDLVIDLQKKNPNVVTLMGNHEKMLLDYFLEGDDIWFFNGGEATLTSFGGEEAVTEYLDWFKALKPCYETEDYFFSHAGVNPEKDFQSQSLDDLVWTRERFIFSHGPFEKRIIFGHTPSQSVSGESAPYGTLGGATCIDTGCVFGGSLTALVINEDKTEEILQVKNEKRIYVI